MKLYPLQLKVVCNIGINSRYTLSMAIGTESGSSLSRIMISDIDLEERNPAAANNPFGPKVSPVS